MTPDEILEVDAKRNHPAGTLAGHLRAEINQELRQKGQVIQQGDTLIVFRSTKHGVVEYHCFNADTPENLAKNVLSVWGMFKKLGFKTAVTPYQNPKISELFKQFSKPYKTEIKTKGDVITATTNLAGD